MAEAVQHSISTKSEVTSSSFVKEQSSSTSQASSLSSDESERTDSSTEVDVVVAKSRTMHLESNPPGDIDSIGATNMEKFSEDHKKEELTIDEENFLLYENERIKEIFSHPNIVSMCYTHKLQNGEKKVLQVGVVKKDDEMKTLIPEMVQSNEKEVPIQVIEEGELKLCQRFSGGAQLRVIHDGKYTYGTLGARVKEGNTYYLYSCAHALTKFKEENIGKPIEVAQSSNGPYEDLGWIIGGHVIENEHIGRHDPNVPMEWSQDIAWAEVKEDDISNMVADVCEVNEKRRPVKNEPVIIRGGYSGRTLSGPIASTNCRCKVKKLSFNRMCFMYRGKQPELEKGDSGSAVVNKETNSLVGIFMGDTEIKTYFSAAIV